MSLPHLPAPDLGRTRNQERRTANPFTYLEEVWSDATEPGAQGLPGEVSLQQLTDAIATTSSNSNYVSTLEMTVNDPPTQGEVQLIANKLDELINALRR